MRVLNKRTDSPSPDAVYVGRPSPWGNPYIIGRDGDRATVIQKFKAYALLRIQSEPDWLAPLVGHDLVCWCAPSPCHAEVLLDLANPNKINGLK